MHKAYRGQGPLFCSEGLGWSIQLQEDIIAKLVPWEEPDTLREALPFASCEALRKLFNSWPWVGPDCKVQGAQLQGAESLRFPSC